MYRSLFQNATIVAIALSDFHKIIVIVCETFSPKSKLKEIVYRNYKKFDIDEVKVN